MTLSGRYAHADRLLDSGQIELLTSDVFDTLVWRAVASPHHQFHHVGARLQHRGLLPAHLDPLVFVNGRVHAERRARGEVHDHLGHRECTLEEIWERMPLSWRHRDDADWSRARDVELEVETELLHVHPEALSLLHTAHRNHVPIVLVSDTYLSSHQLKRMLAHAGVPVDLVQQVVTSSDHRLGKADGLLRHVIASAGVSPECVLHIGDNPCSDVTPAREIGAWAIATDVERTQRHVTGIADAIDRYSAVTGSDGGLTATMRAALVRADEPADHAAFQFGALFGGPLLTSFATWASDTAAELGAEHLHLLLREGAFVSELASITRPKGPAHVLVHASRWVNMRAAVIDGTPYELARALLRKAPMRAEHVTECFGVDVGTVQRLIGRGEIPDDRRWAAFDALAGDAEIRETIVAAAANLRRRLMPYLERTLQPTATASGQLLVVCDIGWGGTIQEGLEAVLRHEGWDVDVVGLYLLLSAPGDQRVDQGADMRAYLPSRGRSEGDAAIVTRNPELLEELCTPPLETLVDMTDDGQPVTRPVDDHAARSRQLARDGVIAFACAAADLGTTDEPVSRIPDPQFRAALLEGAAQVIQRPSPALAEELGCWSHDDVAGSDPRGLVDSTLRRSLPYLGGADAPALSMREVFWLPGVAAAANPVLAAHLDAMRLGIDPSELCPPGELGEATLAVFTDGSDEAVVLTETVPRQGPSGWLVVRAGGAARDVRAIRIDFGEHRGLVQLGYVEVSYTLDGGGPDTRRVVTSVERLDLPTLSWHAGRPVGTTHALVDSDAHLVLQPDPAAASVCDHVEVVCVFRAWRTDDRLDAGAPARARRRLARALRRLQRQVAGR